MHFNTWAALVKLSNVVRAALSADHGGKMTIRWPRLIQLLDFFGFANQPEHRVTSTDRK